MRIFGSDSMNNILKKLGLLDSESIDHPWINKALERAQQKVEARNFDIRKTLLRFDDVLNDQRHVIFNQRREVLEESSSFELINKFLNDEIDEIIQSKEKATSKENLKNYVGRAQNLISRDVLENIEIQSLSSENLKTKVIENFERKRNERIKFLGNEGANDVEKKILLQSIDINWKNHIQYLEQLRQVIGLRSYGQRDPLVEYKKESFISFEKLLDKIRLDTIIILSNIKVVEENRFKKKTYKR